MSISGSSHKAKVQNSQPRAVSREEHRHATTAALQAALAREEALLLEKSEILRRQNALALEFEHRLLNSLQLVTDMLTMQCRTAPTPEAAAQLSAAARRVGAVGRVHCRLHVLDRQEGVEFRQYLQDLCDDLASLLFHDPRRAIIVQGPTFEMPTALGIPLGFIVNELITNATKYTVGNITVAQEPAVEWSGTDRWSAVIAKSICHDT
jgi:two-component sensor histidine kinase